MSNAGNPAGSKVPSAETVFGLGVEQSGASLGKYELKKSIGSGGMGTVYLAVDTDLKRTVALKILPRERAANKTLVKRFRSEAQAAAQLKHENIVSVYEAGEISGHLYIALEYIEGTDVHKLVEQRGVVPLRRSVEIIRQVVQALVHAHEKGIVHRDIKPSNLLIQRNGVVKLADMGLARSVDDAVETGITRAGMTVGTVDYMAPEQARDSKVADVRSDIYSLGCTWYHMLTASPPFPEGSLTNKLYAHVAKPRPDPREINDEIPENVVYVMHKMMARKPEGRYQTPGELLKELESLSLRREFKTEAIVEAIEEEAEVVSPITSPRSKRTPSTFIPPRAPAQSSQGSAEDSSEKSSAIAKNIAIAGAAIALLAAAIWIIGNISFERDKSDHIANPNPFDAGRQKNSTPGNQKGDAAQALSNDPAFIQSRRSTANVSKPPNRSQGSLTEDDPGKTPPPHSNNQTAQDAHANRVPVQKLPSWADSVWTNGRDSGNARRSRLAKFTVGRVEDGPASQYLDLQRAFEGLRRQPAKTGARIELVGDGPFLLPSMELAGFKDLVIAASEGSRPVIVLVPGRRDHSENVCRIKGGGIAAIGRH